MRAEARRVRVVVASPSRYRQEIYQAAIQGLGYEVMVASRGIDCVAYLKQQRPDLLVLESFLPWGGCDGVLEVAQTELGLDCPVIVVVVSGRPADWLELSRFRVDDFLPRFPGLEALQQLMVQTVGAPASIGSQASHSAAKDTSLVPPPHASDFKKPTEKRHHPEGSALTSTPPHAGTSVPQVLAARGAMPVVGPSAASGPQTMS